MDLLCTLPVCQRSPQSPTSQMRCKATCLSAFSFALTALLFCVSPAIAQAEKASAPKDAKQKHVRLLTIGNSFSRNATNHLDEIVESNGHKLTHKPVVVGGASMELHATKALKHEADPKAEDGLYNKKWSLQDALKSNDWDYVTIQQASFKSYDLKNYRPYASQLQKIIKRYAPGAELLVHQTWAYRSDDPWFTNPKEGTGLPKSQSEMYQESSSAYKIIAADLGVRRIPVGDAFYMADTDKKFGYQIDKSFNHKKATSPELPNQTHSLHVGWKWRKQGDSKKSSLRMDGHHANIAGEYLGACVWYEFLYNESCVGTPYVPKGIEKEYANFLQETAHRAVLNVKEATPNSQKINYQRSKPQRYQLRARASKLDPRTKEYPEINFVFGTDKKPQDLENASVDTRVAPKGKLVIWLMGYNDRLFERLNNYGLHAIQVSYANKWFSKLCRPQPKDAQARGNVRLEAATGEDFSDELDLQVPDGMAERSYQFVKWLAKENPEGNWGQFLSRDGKSLDWSKVIISGSSHGSTTAARFAKHQRVDRVVMLCGPRDQDQDWQANDSATPENRYFGFSHVLDGGWSGDHYCRSWELLGMHKFGPIVNVDEASVPYKNSRRLISAADVNNDARRAHSSVGPGGSSPKNEKGEYLYEPVWKYLYTHPVDKVGKPTEEDPNCKRVHIEFK